MAGQPSKNLNQNPLRKVSGNAPPGFDSHFPSIRSLLPQAPHHALRNTPSVCRYGVLPDSQTIIEDKGNYMSCQELEDVLLSRRENKISTEIDHHEPSTKWQLPLPAFQELPHPTIPTYPINFSPGTPPQPPPGFQIQPRGPIYMTPTSHIPLTPTAGPSGLTASPQPQMWSPARLQHQQNTVDQSLQNPQKKHDKEYEPDDAIKKKLRALSLKFQNISGNSVDHFHSLEYIEQQVLRNHDSSKKKKNQGKNPNVEAEKERMKKENTQQKSRKDKKKKKSVDAEVSCNEGSNFLDKQNNEPCPTSEKEKENKNDEEAGLKKNKKKKKSKGNASTSLDTNKISDNRVVEDILESGVFSQANLSEDGTVLKSKTQDKKRSKNRKSRDSELQFEPYLPKQVVKAGIRKKTLIEGEFRINAKNYLEAFITDSNSGQDILIMGLLDRNRALDGDIVAVQIKDEDQWQEQKSGPKTKTGKVVSILERVHKGQTIGNLQLKGGVYMLISRDPRFPILKIPSTSIPSAILGQLKEGQRDTANLYLGYLLSWNIPRYANGVIKEIVGKKGDIVVETEAIFAELGLNKNPIPSSFNRFLPSLPYEITQEEVSSRLDLRSEVIFTIDPSTARDLDDAVSIKKLTEGVYEVGVHISDVTHFLKEGTPLDLEVSERATTVYMVERAYHMLPLELCGLCSLLPGEDKLALSVIFLLDREGNVLDTKFARTVINSCTQLSYDHAQAIINGEDVDLPMIYNDVPVSSIKEAILELNKIAVHRRQRRFDNGALKIDQPKVGFDINSDCIPQSMFIYELKDSHRLIEEYMLLANEAVAIFIHSKFPKIALLRRHDPPKEEMMNKVVSSLQKMGIFLDMSCAGTFYQTLTKYINGDVTRATVLNQICAKPMNRAMYFCCSEETHHYALNVDKYTHFTSPIRRYADIVVHRVLTACLGYSELPPWTKYDVSKFATISNRKKYAAKKAGDLSCNLFRMLYIKNIGGTITDAVVTWVNSRSVDTTIPSMALNIRVYVEKLEYQYIDNDIGSSIIVKWPGTDSVQVLQIFCVIKISLIYSEKNDNLEAKLLSPEAVEELESLSDVNNPQTISVIGENSDAFEHNNSVDEPLLVSTEDNIIMDQESLPEVSDKELNESLLNLTVTGIPAQVQPAVELPLSSTSIQLTHDCIDLAAP